MNCNYEITPLVFCVRAKGHSGEHSEEPESRYWMNDETGRVIEMESSPGRLWFEIDFETYYNVTHTGRNR